MNIPINDNLGFSQGQTIIQPHFDKLNAIPTPINQSEERNKNQVILIAEDNDDLRIYYKNLLSERYKVLSAKNGSQALEISLEVLPDLVITDILMPVMDGIELVNILKENQKTNHIPIIVLTALSESEYQKESIMKGADSFLTKPIDESILIAQIDNILLSRSMLKKKYSATGTVEENSKNKYSFIESAEKVIEQNLQNSEFDTDQLADALNISRSTLYRKIKTELNLNSTEFIRNIRLQNAIKLMKTGKYNMDEIGYYVGFNSTSYFNRSFKKKYGMTPKEYSNKNNLLS